MQNEKNVFNKITQTPVLYFLFYFFFLIFVYTYQSINQSIIYLFPSIKVYSKKFA